MNTPEIQSWLKNASLLRNLPEDLLLFIAGHVRKHQLCDREFLFLQGDPGDFIGFVVKGLIYHQIFGPDGRELIVACSAPGEIVGLSAFSGVNPRKTAARASGTTQVLTLSYRHFLALLRELAFLEQLVAWLSDQCERNLDFIESACLYPLEARLARHILRNLEKGEVFPCLRLPAHQGLLAAMINVSRSKLNIRLQSWKMLGLIHVRENLLFIDDLPQIRRLACFSN